MDQLSLFDNVHFIGEWIDEKFVGDIIPFKELKKFIGKEIVLDKSTESTSWYKIIRLEKSYINGNGINYIFYDGKDMKGSICEFFYIYHGDYKGRFPTICYYLK